MPKIPKNVSLRTEHSGANDQYSSCQLFAGQRTYGSLEKRTTRFIVAGILYMLATGSPIGVMAPDRNDPTFPSRSMKMHSLSKKCNVHLPVRTCLVSRWNCLHFSQLSFRFVYTYVCIICWRSPSVYVVDVMTPRLELFTYKFVAASVHLVPFLILFVSCPLLARLSNKITSR